MANLGNAFTSELPVLNLRTGPLEGIAAIVPTSVVASQYHWHVVRRVPDDRAMAYAELNMRLTYALISVAEPAMQPDKKRSQAIILGAMRTGLRVYWNVVDADLVDRETGDELVTYRAEAGNVAEGVTIAWGDDLAVDAGAAWQSWVALNEAEREVAEAFILLSVAALPTAGWSIVKSGRHFLPQGGSAARAGYTAVKKQWFTKISPGAAAWVRQREEYWEDIAFHKACHPVSLSTLVTLASSRETKLKLESVDFGAAAVRLPATAPQLEYAKMVLALLVKVGGVLIAAGATVNTDKLTEAVASVYEATDPATRASNTLVATSLAHSQDASLAIAAGILLHITEAGASSTIANSFGFKRLTQEFPVDVAKGSTLSRSLTVRERQAISEGGVVALSIVF